MKSVCLIAATCGLALMQGCNKQDSDYKEQKGKDLASFIDKTNIDLRPIQDKVSESKRSTLSADEKKVTRDDFEQCQKIVKEIESEKEKYQNDHTLTRLEGDESSFQERLSTLLNHAKKISEKVKNKFQKDNPGETVLFRGTVSSEYGETVFSDEKELQTFFNADIEEEAPPPQGKESGKESGKAEKHVLDKSGKESARTASEEVRCKANESKISTSPNSMTICTIKDAKTKSERIQKFDIPEFLDNLHDREERFMNESKNSTDAGIIIKNWIKFWEKELKDVKAQKKKWEQDESLKTLSVEELKELLKPLETKIEDVVKKCKNIEH